MATQMDTVLESALSGIYKTTERGSYSPTMVIGLGGAGLKVLRHLKKYLNRGQHQEITLMGIDSDSGENQKYPELPPLSASELVLLDPAPAMTDLARADKKNPEAQYIQSFLPEQHGGRKTLRQSVRAKIQTRKGAGQFRRAGKLLFGANVNNGANLNNRIRNARNDLVGLAARLSQEVRGVQIEPGTRVFVVSSTSGGTGAGTVLDCLALLRSHFDNINDIITLILLLPGAALYKELQDPATETRTTRGNAIGLLRELQALMLGEVKRVFEFDGATKYSFDGSNPLVHDCYLVDEELWDGTPVETWFDMCQATGYFLYGILGTGVGASRESGAINGKIDTNVAGQKQIPRVFNAFGVGVLEYPVSEMTNLAMKHTLNALLERWCCGKPDRKATEAEVETTLAEMGLADLQTFRGKWDFNPATAPETQYLRSAGALSSAMHDPDDKFLQGGDRAVNGVDGELAAYEKHLRSRQESLVKEAFDALERRARSLVTGNHAVADQHWDDLGRRLDALLEDHNGEMRDRIEDQAKLKKDFERLKKSINFFDFYTDVKFRKSYVTKVNQYLQSRGDSYLDGFVTAVLSAVRQRGREVEGQVRGLTGAMDNTRVQNAKAFEQLLKLEHGRRLAFVQRVFPGGSFEQWIKDVDLKPKERFEASELKEMTVLKEALQPALEELQKVLKSLNIVEDIKRSEDLRNRARSLNTSSQPIVRVVADGPREADLVPQKYVGAKHMEGDEYLKGAEMFPQVGFGGIRLIPSDNQHAVICLQTRHGFGVAHWLEYEAAKNCYREDEWYFGVFGADEAVPELEKVSREKAKLLELFGLALMFQFIVTRGNNYYRNLVFSSQDKAYFFLTYTKTPNSYAQALLDGKMVLPALQTAARPIAGNLLGDSLEKAIEALGQSAQGDFVGAIQDVVAEFVAAVGKKDAQAKIMEYKRALEADAAMIQDNTERKDLLASVVKSLQDYAEKSITAAI